MELGQFEIYYEPRKAIKGQAVVDFIREGTRKSENGPWTAYVDGSSTMGKCGAGIVLIDPEGAETEYAVHLGFRASNNEAEPRP